MSTPTNVTHHKSIAAGKHIEEKHTHRFAFIVIGVVALTLAAAIYLNLPKASTNEAVGAIAPSVPYSHALEMQYAQPWLNAMNRVTVTYGNAMAMQYAQPWLDAMKKTNVTCGNSMEMQYAKPWLDAQKTIVCP